MFFTDKKIVVQSPNNMAAIVSMVCQYLTFKLQVVS